VRRSLQQRRPRGDVEPRSDAAVYLRRIAGKLAEGIGAAGAAAAPARAGGKR
jgi:hypothetical protein